MDCIAHRGFAGEHPENTLAAAREAAAVADWIEVDVRRCGSGEPVVIHDETVDRVTDARGRVDSYTASELSALDVLESGEGVPTLAALLEVVPSSVGLDVELKEAGVAADAVDLLEGRPRPVFVSSFDPVALDRARESIEETSAVPTALIGADDPGDLLARATEVGSVAVCLHHDICEDQVVERAHAAGLDVYAWTLRDREAAEQCAEAGVDGLISDYRSCCHVGQE